MSVSPGNDAAGRSIAPITSNSWPSTSIVLPIGSMLAEPGLLDILADHRHRHATAVFHSVKKRPMHLDLPPRRVSLLDADRFDVVHVVALVLGAVIRPPLGNSMGRHAPPTGTAR